MALIQNPAISRKLQRFLRLTALPDAVLSPETVPVVVVEDLSAPLSDQERGCSGVGNILAVAGEISLLSLVRVGAPASYDLIVTGIIFSAPNNNTTIRVHQAPGGIGTLTILPHTSFHDFSIPGRPTSQLGFDTQVGIPAGRILYEYNVLAGTTYRIPVNIRIGTVGDGVEQNSITVAMANTAEQLQAGFEWTESGPLG